MPIRFSHPHRPPPTEGLTAIMAFFGSECVSETRRAREGPVGCLHCKQKAVLLGIIERSIYSRTLRKWLNIKLWGWKKTLCLNISPHIKYNVTCIWLGSSVTKSFKGNECLLSRLSPIYRPVKSQKWFWNYHLIYKILVLLESYLSEAAIAFLKQRISASLRFLVVLLHLQRWLFKCPS